MIGGYLYIWRAAFAAIVLLIILSIYIATPLGGDQQVSVAAAHQADFHGSFPQNVVESWDMRGLLCKFVMYIFYRTAIVFTDFFDKNSFEMAFRSVAAITVLTLLAVGALVSRRFLRKNRIEPMDAFFVFAISALTITFRCTFQAEDMACWVCILGTACALSESRLLQIVGGVLLSLTAGFKGITAVMGVLGCVAVFLLARDDRRRLWTIGISFFLGTIALAGSLILWAPTEVQDLRNATLFNDSFGPGLFHRLKILVIGVSLEWPQIPILLPGEAAAIYCFLSLWRRRAVMSMLIFAAMWLLPFTVVSIQGKGFDYHFLALWPVAAGSVVAALSFMRATPEYNKNWERILLAAPVVMGLMCATVNPFWWLDNTRYTRDSSSIFVRRNAVWSERNEYADLLKHYQLREQPNILYLDWGISAYYFGTKSYSRYFFPFPIHRLSPKVIKSAIHDTTLEEVMRYKGEFVLWHYRWLRFTNRPDLDPLYAKLEREYVPVYENDLFRLLRRR